MEVSSMLCSDGPATGVVEEVAPAGAGRRAAHVADTRRALLDSARALFGEHGFHETRTEEIVRRAGLTRGALYHHFEGKEDLFRAVHEEVADEVAQSLHRREDGRAEDAWEMFRANSEVYLEAASRNRPYRQIVLVDGPAVLGPAAWKKLQRGPTEKIAAYARDAMAAGVVEPLPVETLAHLLSALGTGGALYVAHAEQPSVARDEVARCTEQLLSGLLRRRGSGTAGSE
ncbi:MAG: TetR/AcrR family transcriptional regulator [Acidimicrobiales bacterium]